MHEKPTTAGTVIAIIGVIITACIIFHGIQGCVG